MESVDRHIMTVPLDCGRPFHTGPDYATKRQNMNVVVYQSRQQFLVYKSKALFWHGAWAKVDIVQTCHCPEPTTFINN